jgi:hypothetical protein
MDGETILGGGGTLEVDNEIGFSGDAGGIVWARRNQPAGVANLKWYVFQAQCPG